MLKGWVHSNCKDCEVKNSTKAFWWVHQSQKRKKKQFQLECTVLKFINILGQHEEFDIKHILIFLMKKTTTTKKNITVFWLDKMKLDTSGRPVGKSCRTYFLTTYKRPSLPYVTALVACQLLMSSTSRHKLPYPTFHQPVLTYPLIYSWTSVLCQQNQKDNPATRILRNYG